MSVRIYLEIGHEASLRTKKTPDGFTHDWEVYVRGCDGADIQQFIERVVFHLHDTFPKPKRVCKEPPYVVKESGYAGFNIPIEIYLKNKDEPKRIKFTYDLTLQSTGPTKKVQRERYVFFNPSDEFKYRLLKAGGMTVSSSNNQEFDSKSTSESKVQLLNKPKMSSSSSSSNDPKKHKVKTTAVEEPRESSDFKFLFGTPIKTTAKQPEPKSLSTSKDLKASKEKEKSVKSKSPNKDRDREKNRAEKDSERKKDKSKERNKEHERSKEKKRDKSPKARSPSPSKRSPKRPEVRPSSPKRLPSPAKEEKRKDDSKKYKKRDKEYSESKYKDTSIAKSKETNLRVPPVLTREKELSPIPASKFDKKEKMPKLEVNKEAQETLEKLKNEEKVKEKHKHKKKDKDRDKDKREKSKEHKVKNSEKKYDAGSTNNTSSSLFASPKPDLKLMANSMKVPPPISDLENDNSNSSNSSASSVVAAVKEEPPSPPVRPAEAKEDAAQKHKRDKVKRKEKRADKEEKKRNKRKAEKPLDEPETKIARAEEDAIPASQSKELDKENQENQEEYMKILRELQHKIMSLQDNTELQKVVELIAETGRYEVSARTFDFDLCLLERSTVRRLQEFFSGS